jgi:mono/diheme cytochrome c family protein
MAVRHTLLLRALFLITCGALAQTGPPAGPTEFPSTYVPSGERMYKQFCAACHGAKGRPLPRSK